MDHVSDILMRIRPNRPTLVQMEVEEGANSTVTDLLSSLLEEEELGLPRVTQVSSPLIGRHLY